MASSERAMGQKLRSRHQEESSEDHSPAASASSIIPSPGEPFENQGHASGRMIPRASSYAVGSIHEAKFPYASIFSTFCFTTLIAFFAFACLSRWAAVQLQGSDSGQPPPSQDLSRWKETPSQERLQTQRPESTSAVVTASINRENTLPGDIGRGDQESFTGGHVPVFNEGEANQQRSRNESIFSRNGRPSAERGGRLRKYGVSSSITPLARSISQASLTGPVTQPRKSRATSAESKERLPFQTWDSADLGPESAPKVAFLFLTRGNLPLRELWEHFFTTSGGRASVYVHAAVPGFNVNKNLTKRSFFWGSQVPQVNVVWGGFGMIEAEKRLLKSALGDKRNQRFVLLSESCIPIRSFDFVYTYLFNSKLSFLASYPSTWRLGGAVIERAIPKKKFRKGSQWFALTRAHAKLAAEEKYYFGIFQQAGVKIPDETYFQTVLPLLDPDGFEERPVTFVQWYGYRWRREKAVEGGDLGPGSYAGRPRTFYLEDASGKALGNIQNLSKTAAERVSMRAFSEVLPCTQGGKPAPCYLFARKFAAEAVPQLLQLRQLLGY